MSKKYLEIKDEIRRLENILEGRNRPMPSDNIAAIQKTLDKIEFTVHMFSTATQNNIAHLKKGETTEELIGLLSKLLDLQFKAARMNLEAYALQKKWIGK